MTEKNFADFGKQLSDSVQKAVSSQDFAKIKETVTSTMKDVVDQTVSFGRQMSGQGRQTAEKRQKSSCHNYAQPTPCPSYQKRIYYHPVPSAAYANQYMIKPNTTIVSGRLEVVLGSIFMAGVPLTAPSMLARGSQIAVGNVADVLSSAIGYGIILAFLLFGGIFMLAHGVLKLRQVKRHKAYCGLLAERHYCELGKLAEEVGKSPKYVAKDLRNMMVKGWFVQGHLDRQETSFLLGEGLYQQYLLAEKGRQEREQQAFAIARDPNGPAAVAAEGREWLNKIRRANDMMPEKIITAKLNRLEIVVEKIFQHVEEHTEKLPEIRRFMSYYLPTTVKLVDCYYEYEIQPIQLESIAAAKKEISETLDVINTAFETLLNDLYEDDMLDISTDISALKTILTQEGLVESGLYEQSPENNKEGTKNE